MHRHKWLFATDLDGTLLGNEDALLRFRSLVDEFRTRFFLIYNSGRSCAKIKEYMTQAPNLPLPDFLVGSMGTEIEYGLSGRKLQSYRLKIGQGWNRSKVVDFMNSMNVQPQDKENQTPFKVSYCVPQPRTYEKIIENLSFTDIQAKVIYSGDIYLDVIPPTAGKGQATEFLIKKLSIPPSKVIVSGDSENDLEMLLLPYKGIIVKNATSKLKKLENRNIFHAHEKYADGVIEGLKFWGLI